MLFPFAAIGPNWPTVAAILELQNDYNRPARGQTAAVFYDADLGSR